MPIRLADLNPPQREAVTTIDGPLLVLAGAGSGKTRVITYRIAHLLACGARPDQLLAVSFTNKAADEMRERVERLCPPKQARQLTLSTFHSLGLLILKAESAALGMSGGFTIYDTADQLGVVREILRDAKVSDRRIDVKNILSRISRCKNAGLSPAAFIEQLRKARAVSEYDGFAAEVFPRYAERMRALHAFDFDDLLVETLRLLREDAGVRKRWQTRFRYLMIDEYQDTNRCQLDLLRLLCAEHGNLAVVGDDDQSIYGWRGAESRNILEFAQQFPGARVIKLEENYRSTGIILRAANAVIAKNTQRHHKTLWTSRGDGDLIEVIVGPDETAEAAFVAEEIDRLLATRRYQLRDMAVLYRATKQSEPIEEAFRAARIDYRVIGGTAFFERKEVKDAIAYLKVLVYPHDELALRRVINYPARGLGPTAMERLTAAHKQAARQRRDTSLWDTLSAIVRSGAAKAEAKAREQAGLFAPRLGPELVPAPVDSPEVGEPLSDRARAALTGFVDCIQRHRVLLQQAPPGELHAAAERFLRELGVHDDLTRSGPTALQAERRLRSLNDFLASMQRYAERAGAGFDLAGYLNRMSLSSQDDDADDSLRDTVTLSTLHGAKGLEFRVVFFIGVEEELLPHKRSLYPREADQTLASSSPGEDPDGSGQPSDIAEERRLCYVGITRARERLYISWVRQRNGRLDLRCPSRFLDDIPKDAYRERDLEGPPAQNDPDEEARMVREMIERAKAVSA
jgi:DNA helicase-2/ATP-dependent DNA helicase PcrA